MNEEKKIAQAILDAQKMHEESYVEKSGNYKLDIEKCFMKTCEKHGLSPNLWLLLSLAMHWCNDICDWADDVLAGKDIPRK